MSLPHVEKTPVILVVFNSQKASNQLIALVKNRLIEEGLLVNSETDYAFGLTASLIRLEQEAERVHLLKERVDTETMEYFTRDDRNLFVNVRRKNREPNGIFTPNECLLLVHHILERIEVLKYKQHTSELSQLLDEYHAAYQMDLQLDSGLLESKQARRRLKQHGAHSASLRHVLQTYGLTKVITPVHLPSMRDEVLNQTLWPWYKLSPEPDIFIHYYGWEVAFYFAWMGFLTRWLIVPGCMGVLVFLLRWYRQDTIDEDEYTPFYGLVTFVWAVLFLRFWDRQENTLSYKWGTLSLSIFERQKYFATRPEFRGFLRESPVTGDIEVYYPSIRRRLKCIVSSLVTISMLALAFIVMIISLNAQGYIRPSSNRTRWNSDNQHPFHIAPVAALAEHDQWFDATSVWKCYIPVVLHVVCILTLNNCYRGIAEILTQWENHETEENHRNSLVLKRFLFEAFDCYIALFYLAFYERDVERLRGELIAIFQIDSIRRIFLESIVPMILQHSHGLSRNSHNSAKRNTPIASSLEELIREAEKDEYDNFDDYMEMVIQFGYVTLFASAYPLASLVAIAANWIELRSDSWKLANVCRRPFSFRSSSIGIWKTIMACIVWMSALTNCLIAGITSDQLMHYIPSFYVRDDTGSMSLGHEKGYLLIFLIFALERLLIIVGLMIYAIVPALPENLQNELERRQYQRWKDIRHGSDKKVD